MLVRYLDSTDAPYNHADARFDPLSRKRESRVVPGRTNRTQFGTQATVMTPFTATQATAPSTPRRNRLWPIVAFLLGLALIGSPAGQAQETPVDGSGSSTDSTGSQSSEEPTHDDSQSMAPIAVPIVVSSPAGGNGAVSTTIYVSNHSDSEVTATFQFRNDSGADLQMPVATVATDGATPTFELKSSHDLVIGANGTGQVELMQGTPSKKGWAEVTTAPPAHLSVSATTVRTATSTQKDFVEIPSTPSYRRAWLAVDSTGGLSTELVLVNNSTDTAQDVHLNYRSGDVSCSSSVKVPSNGRSTVNIPTALTCSAGLLGTIELNGAGLFTGIATITQSGTGQVDSFSRSLTGLADMDPVPLDAWTVTSGRVQLEYLSSAGCLSVNSLMLVGVSYTVYDSVWQARIDDTSEWVDLPGTAKSGQICAYSPTEPGEYRGVAQIAVDGVPGLYSSNESISIAAPTIPVGGYAPVPSFVVGKESVQFGTLSGACVSSTEPIQVDLATYEIHSSKWQRRADENAVWADIDGTSETSQICAHSPSSAGQYRAVAEVSRNGVRGTYVSSNVVTEAPPTTPVTSTSTPGTEECSDIVGCFIPLPAGTFQMGSDSDEADSDETPLTQVKISEGVQLAKYELTHAQWELIMGPAAAYVESDCEETCPIVAVAFTGINDVKIPLFLELLNSRDTAYTYRLPTEAEWEYAARAGTTGDRYGDLDDIAWHAGNSNKKIQPIGTKDANAWGFYDMLGNVFEWVQDIYGPYPGGSVTDPTGPATESRRRMTRGGSYLSTASAVRAPNRDAKDRGWLSPQIGIRLARVKK